MRMECGDQKDDGTAWQCRRYGLARFLHYFPVHPFLIMVLHGIFIQCFSSSHDMFIRLSCTAWIHAHSGLVNIYYQTYSMRIQCRVNFQLSLKFNILLILVTTTSSSDNPLVTISITGSV